MIQPPAVGDGGSSRRKGIVAKENAASLDWIIVVVEQSLIFIEQLLLEMLTLAKVVNFH